MLQAGDIAGGRFRLIRPIGAGGMACVWWARHELIGRDVALKLSPSSEDDQVVGRFIREAKIIGKFHHRNIVGVVDAGVLHEEGYVFLAMELLRGAPFSQRLVPQRALAPEEVVPIVAEVCRGLEVAHAHGVVHRDVKPENIFLATVPGEGIVPKLVDFGISRLEEARDDITFDGQLLGTPSYMSPEQALGARTVDARADLWAVGVILYEALSGRQPFKAESHFGTLRQITDADPPPLSDGIDARLRAIVARCLEKDPARRYQDAASLRADLAAALAASGAPRQVVLAAPSAPRLAALVAPIAPRPPPLVVPAAVPRPLPARAASRLSLARRMVAPGAWSAGRLAGAAALAGVVAAAVMWGAGAMVSAAAPAGGEAALSAYVAPSVRRAMLVAATSAAPKAKGSPAVEALDSRADDSSPIRETARVAPAPRPAQHRIRVTRPGF